MIIALFIISLLTVSAVNAEDNSTFDVASAENPNEKITIESNNNVVSDNSSILTVTPDNTNKNSYDENISTNKNNVILKKSNEETLKSENPLYEIVDIGSNTMVLEIFKIKDMENLNQCFHYLKNQ